MTETIDFAIVMTSGEDTPRRLASPFFLAATAAAEEMNVVVYFTGMGTTLLKKGVAENLYPKADGGMPLSHFMNQALENGAQFVICKASMDLHNMTEDELGYDVPKVSVAAALPYLEAAEKMLSF